jgi:hypothetical protein
MRASMLKVFKNKTLGVTVSGKYEQRGTTYWVLTEWQVISTYEGRTTVGDWHRVHGNQKKDLGQLKLVVTNEEYFRA